MIQTTNSRQTLNLLFPQWQGSGMTNELYHGVMLIHDRLKDRGRFFQVPVSLDRTLKVENKILGYSPILQQLTKVRETIWQHNPDRLFVIGGDCSIDIAPISFLNHKYARDLAVIWIDAHADLNTPASSPSHHFHGMPLRVLLGEGDAKIIELSDSVLSSKQVFLVGARDFDPPEQNYLEQNDISLFTPEKIQGNSQNLIEAIANSGYRNIHVHEVNASPVRLGRGTVHCDLDAIDPLEFPWVKCPAANGLSIEFLTELLEQLERRFNLVGFSITEFAPRHKQGLENIMGVVDRMFELFQHQSN